MKDFGVDIQDIWVHSRKGASSYVSSGSTCAPPQVAPNIRARWSICIIQDTYLRYDTAGDHYVGRIVCGLPLSSPKFAILPCQVNCTMDECDEMVTTFFPTIPDTLRCLYRFFAAWILYHSNYLKIDLPPSHPFFNILFFTSEKVPAMKTKAYVKCAWQ